MLKIQTFHPRHWSHSPKLSEILWNLIVCKYISVWACIKASEGVGGENMCGTEQIKQKTPTLSLAVHKESLFVSVQVILKQTNKTRRSKWPCFPPVFFFYIIPEHWYQHIKERELVNFTSRRTWININMKQEAKNWWGLLKLDCLVKLNQDREKKVAKPQNIGLSIS